MLSRSLLVQEQHPYAYGAPLTGLSYVVGNKRYRYGCQGQYAEQDSETGWESFELRLYNSRIGRWASQDPEGQFSSPYVGVGNNPVSQVDPDGGLSGAVWGGIIGAGVGATAGGIIGYSQGGTDGMWGGIIAGATIGGMVGGAIGLGAGKIADRGVVHLNSLGQGTVQGMDLTFQAFRGAYSQLNASPHNTYPADPTLRGAFMHIETGSDKTIWAQTVTTNNVENVPKNLREVSLGTGNQYDRQENVPYYDSNDSKFAFMKGRFVDIPQRSPSEINGRNFYWKAESSIIRKIPGINGNSAVFTITWGFSYDAVNDVVKLNKVRMHRIPSAIHQRHINGVTTP